MATEFDSPSAQPVANSSGLVTTAWLQFFQRVKAVCNAAQQSGPTASRPTAGLWIGRRYYDTDLELPVFVHSINPTVWHDAAGSVA